MNTSPHTHEVKIVSKYPNENGGLGVGPWYVEYGDTKVKFAGFFAFPYDWPEDKQRQVIGAAIEKAIKQHDQGSIEAGERERKRSVMRRVVDDHNNVVAPTTKVDLRYSPYSYRETLKAWGTDLVAKKKRPALPAGK